MPVMQTRFQVHKFITISTLKFELEEWIEYKQKSGGAPLNWGNSIRKRNGTAKLSKFDTFCWTKIQVISILDTQNAKIQPKTTELYTVKNQLWKRMGIENFSQCYTRQHYISIVQINAIEIVDWCKKEMLIFRLHSYFPPFQSNSQMPNSYFQKLSLIFLWKWKCFHLIIVVYFSYCIAIALLLLFFLLLILNLLICVCELYLSLYFEIEWICCCFFFS